MPKSGQNNLAKGRITTAWAVQSYLPGGANVHLI